MDTAKDVVSQQNFIGIIAMCFAVETSIDVKIANRKRDIGWKFKFAMALQYASEKTYPYW